MMSPKIKSAVVKTPQVPPKRRRIKRQLGDLLEQLEFYMSEANLRHDAFMREKAGVKGMNDVPVQLFLSFPLLQEMNATENNIRSAVENSLQLELNDDGCHIRRRFPVPRPPHNLEQSTLYIENLPPDSTTEWLKEVGQKIGTIRHVSLPRFKRTGRIKGFAFVEFSCPEDVSRACRILQDPPKNFFPNRTDKYLKRMNRMKYLTEKQTPATPTEFTADLVEITPTTSESGVLDKSLDSTVDFKSLGKDCGTPTTARKRKRRSRCASSVATTHHPDFDEEESSTPAKKCKSLSTGTSRDDLQKLLDSSTKDSENSNKNNIVSMTTKKKQGRRVIFSITEDKNDTKSPKESKIRAEKPDFCQNCSKKNENIQTFLNNGKILQKIREDGSHYDVMNGVSCDVKIETHEIQCEGCGRNVVVDSPRKLKSSSEIVRNRIAPLEIAEHIKMSGVKRKRSASEPPGIHEIGAGDAKRSKEESSDWSDGNPDPQSPVKIPTTLDINELIAQGRKQSQTTESNICFDVSTKRKMCSVIAKPSIQEKKKSRKRSRNSRERRKARSKQTSPKLNVMPKVQWTELKKEYKKLQKQNMSKLKRTIRENNDVGSVFIKKHLDVLNDINIGNESISSDFSDGEDSAKHGRGTKMHQIMKRGPPTFQPGVIVRISTTETTLDLSGDLRPSQLSGVEEIKSRLNKYGQGVAYVDMKPGESTGFVRFNDGDSAQRAILEERSLALCLLTGELEERYWERLLTSRAQKFAQERPKIRGRTKILSKAEILVDKAKRRHIRFDNDLKA